MRYIVSCIYTAVRLCDFLYPISDVTQKSIQCTLLRTSSHSLRKHFRKASNSPKFTVLSKQHVQFQTRVQKKTRTISDQLGQNLHFTSVQTPQKLYPLALHCLHVSGRKYRKKLTQGTTLRPPPRSETEEATKVTSRTTSDCYDCPVTITSSVKAKLQKRNSLQKPL